MKLQGIIPPIVTPFKKNGSINYELFREFIEYLIEAGVHGIFVGGGTGEYSLLSLEERKHLFEVAVDTANNKIPILAGIDYLNLSESVKLAKIAEASRVAVTVASNPHYPSPGQEGLYNYHKEISQNTAIPHMVYNLPKVGIDMEVKTVVKLAENGYIEGIKDSHNEFWHTIDIIRQTRDDFTVLTGYSKYFLPTLLMGGQGSINTISNLVPGTMVELFESFKSQNIDHAYSLQLQLYPLADLIFSIGPYNVVIKEALQLTGWENMGGARKPLLPLELKDREKLKKELENMDIPELNLKLENKRY